MLDEAVSQCPSEGTRWTASVNQCASAPRPSVQNNTDTINMTTSEKARTTASLLGKRANTKFNLYILWYKYVFENGM